MNICFLHTSYLSIDSNGVKFGCTLFTFQRILRSLKVWMMHTMQSKGIIYYQIHEFTHYCELILGQPYNVARCWTPPTIRSQRPRRKLKSSTKWSGLRTMRGRCKLWQKSHGTTWGKWHHNIHTNSNSDLSLVLRWWDRSLYGTSNSVQGFLWYLLISQQWYFNLYAKHMIGDAHLVSTIILIYLLLYRILVEPKTYRDSFKFKMPNINRY